MYVGCMAVLVHMSLCMGNVQQSSYALHALSPWSRYLPPCILYQSTPPSTDLIHLCVCPQMIAMRFGTVPIVRHTGGLRDTVFDVDYDKERAAWDLYGSSDWQRDGLDATNGFAFSVSIVLMALFVCCHHPSMEYLML